MNKALEEYKNIVESFTSKPSNNIDDLIERLQDMKKNKNRVNLSLLMTGAVGMSCESGEILEIVKKVLFQGKELSDDTLYHIKREMGDILWYYMNTLRALNISFDEVMRENQQKLLNRYPEKQFTVQRSEERQANDL